MASAYKRKSDGKLFYVYNINNFGNFNGWFNGDVIVYLLKSIYDSEVEEVVYEGLEKLFDVVNPSDDLQRRLNMIE